LIGRPSALAAFVMASTVVAAAQLITSLRFIAPPDSIVFLTFGFDVWF
jgi:hypothetical protein